MSNYNYGLEPGIGHRNSSSKVRFVLIFLFVSAVTAAVLWYFWPREEKKINEKNVSSGTPEKILPAVETTLPEPEKKPADIRQNKAESPTAGAGGEKKELPAEEKNNKLPSVADPTDPPLPAKGVLTPADMKGADLPVVAVDHSIDPNREELLKKAEKAFAAKDFSGAEMLVLQALENVRENSAFYRKAWKVLTSYRVSSLYGKSGSRWSVQYRIRPGDSLSGIASRYRTTVELIRKMNNISGSRIYVGRSLWLTPGDWRITVSKASRLLKLYHIGNDKKETLWGVWEIGIGRMGKTPSAEFAIASRVRHPDWYLPDGRVFKYGEPENQLGEYFLKLAPVSSPGRPLLGYGIHGSQDESTVGRSLSNGCVRMRNADVEAVFYLVPNGTRVVISDK